MKHILLLSIILIGCKGPVKQLILMPADSTYPGMITMQPGEMFVYDSTKVIELTNAIDSVVGVPGPIKYETDTIATITSIGKPVYSPCKIDTIKGILYYQTKDNSGDYGHPAILLRRAVEFK